MDRMNSVLIYFCFRKHEKEQKKIEREARKVEKEAAKKLEKETAKLEKTRNKLSRSTERVAPRSGSLERRQSGDENAHTVHSQFTVHGIASPNRRPTLFDVFRPRTKSDVKKKDKDAASASGSSGSGGVGGGGKGTLEKENSTSSSNHSGGSGGIMQSMKTAIQHTVGVATHHHKTPSTSSGTSTSTSKARDGSAHLHAGSDAQYYHTVTAVRRVDATRSPMTKVMDLFRHRANSAATEADKRKAVSCLFILFDIVIGLHGI